MVETEENTDFSRTTAILSCFTLSVVYVASLYIWNSPYHREHNETIKKRFLSAFIMMFVSPLFVYFGISRSMLQKTTIWELLGIKLVGLFQAAVLPLLLTMILFLGPLSVQALNGPWKLYAAPMHSTKNIRSLIWWRNRIVAPLSEEWTFRACMLPLLLECYKPTTAIFICPLFFGVAHFHHVIEMIRAGVKFQDALKLCSFQFVYTTLFGAYAAFLFAKTGHYIAPFTAHAFCNHMGFPDLTEVLACKDPARRKILLSLFFAGVIGWCSLLTPMTNPAWFSNKLFWHIDPL
ncbi:CAAX prenyl protease 2 isoform X1 [Neodiprion pinetum]|uniref:CAAX prenyl protease 2 n=2 Tax=Neodiprion lecontei TaxID=441921 RepID=A0A6J0BZ49_NEOLC|nr:CAAX prenyl protease 2 isoform X1 [Neodiprion lecontei]XP_046419651.1 CAAX prenyl protease 2 isoform X1 [Neodiprion fabricii]